MTDLPGTDRPIQIAPSVLPADFSRLGEEVAALEAAGVDRIQWDVMDGRFVPNLTFGPDVIAACRDRTRSCSFEAHLMVEEPDELLATLRRGRLRAAHRPRRGLPPPAPHARAHPRARAPRPAVALNPATPPEAIEHVLDLCDMVLVMTVNPGFGGQAYIGTMEPKMADDPPLDRSTGGHDVDVEVDGGIGPATIAGRGRRRRQRPGRGFVAVQATPRAWATRSTSSAPWPRPPAPEADMRRSRRVPGSVLVAVVLVSSLVACRGDEPGDVAAFCACGRRHRSIRVDVRRSRPHRRPAGHHHDRGGSGHRGRAPRRRPRRGPRRHRPARSRSSTSCSTDFGPPTRRPTERPEIYGDLRPQFDEVEAAGERISRLGRLELLKISRGWRRRAGR